MAREGTPHRRCGFGDAIDLLGYQVFAEDPHPGGVVRVDLFWLPHVTSNEGHRIDVQFGRDPRIGDGGGPACDKTRADQDWQRRAAVRAAPERPDSPRRAAGPYPLLVSVSRLGAGGGPLPVSAATGGAGQSGRDWRGRGRGQVTAEWPATR